MVGNRLSSLNVPSYSYNSSNELTATSASSFTYDNNGNTLSKTSSGAVTQYTWDVENRLRSVILPGSAGTATFRYDPFGGRIQKVFAQGSTTTTTNYVYDGVNSIEEVDQSATLLARYAHAASVDEPLAELRSGTTSYYQQDGLGSVTSLSSSTGPLANTYVYDSFGNLTISSGTAINPFQYTGRDYDPETGLRYYRARYYDPQNGRFVSEDPTGFDAGNNFYEYADNGPINFVDPFGLQAQPVPIPIPPGRIIPFPTPARPAVSFCTRFPILCALTLPLIPMNGGEDPHAVRCATMLSEPGCAGGFPVPDPNSTNAKPCKTGNCSAMRSSSRNTCVS